jgi:hypothetical protein
MTRFFRAGCSRVQGRGSAFIGNKGTALELCAATPTGPPKAGALPCRPCTGLGRVTRRNAHTRRTRDTPPTVRTILGALSSLGRHVRAGHDEVGGYRAARLNR